MQDNFEDEEKINLDHDMVISPEIMARYQSLNRTEHVRTKRQYPSSRNVIIELAIFTDEYVTFIYYNYTFI